MGVTGLTEIVIRLGIPVTLAKIIITVQIFLVVVAIWYEIPFFIINNHKAPLGLARITGGIMHHL